MNSNSSYSPETVKLGCDLCDLDLWPWPFAWTLLWSLVITPENVMMIRWWEHSKKGVTDGQTENTIYRAAWSQLKTIGHLFYATSSFVHHFVAINKFKLELQSRNAQFGSKSTIFLAVWPWNLMYDIEKPIGHLFYATSSFVHHSVTTDEFKLELQSGNAQFGSNLMIFRAVWPGNLMEELEKQ